MPLRRTPVAAPVLAINIVSRPVQRRAMIAATDSTPRTGIDPNVAAGADLARQIPVAVYVRFAARTAAGNDPVRAAVSRL